MKKWMIATLAALMASGAAAEERRFVCVSDTDGSEMTLTRAAEGDKGSISAADMVGDDVAVEAQVFKGVGNITFLYLKDAEVLTFVVNLSDMSYDLSIKGSNPGNDRGKCEEVSA